MVNSTDFLILALGGVLTVAFLYRDKLPFIGSPAQKTPVPVKAANGLANGGYQGDVRDFATRMKEQVRFAQLLFSCPDVAALRREQGVGWAGAAQEDATGLRTRGAGWPSLQLPVEEQYAAGKP